MNIKELAKEIGVSSATVSRVINNSGYVSDKTKEKVLEAVRKYNYVPNAIARSLSTKDSRSIGVIISDIENEFFSSVISGISQVADENGYNIYFMSTNESIEKEHYFLETVEQQCLAGVIITPVSEDDTVTMKKLVRLQNKGIPVVLVDRDLKGASFDGVFVDNAAGSCQGVKALIREGHKRIAIITGPGTSKPGKERLKGYLNALEDEGIEVRQEYIMSGDFKTEKAYRCTEKLLQMETPPTAIFCSNNMTTIGCLKCLTEHKQKPGRDISLLGFDDIEILKLIAYNLSVVYRDAKLQGKEAMKLMLKKLRDKETKRKEIRVNVPHEVILRGTEKIKGF